MKHLSEDDLVLHYYGELTGGDEAETSSHLSACAACRREFTSLQRVLGAVDESSVSGADLPPNFERTVWARLEPGLSRTDRGRDGLKGWLSMILAPAPLALAATVVLLVAAAFFAGRVSSPSGPAPSTTQADANKVRERILLVDLGEHLERSQMILVELVSAGEDSLDFPAERARAERLVSANRLYRQAATDNGDTAVADLLDELERVLIDVAASPDETTGVALDDMRRRIGSQELLFKVRVVSSKVRDQQRDVIQERTGQRSSAGT
jgi:hypothetical protein